MISTKHHCYMFMYKDCKYMFTDIHYTYPGMAGDTIDIDYMMPWRPGHGVDNTSIFNVAVCLLSCMCSPIKQLGKTAMLF